MANELRIADDTGLTYICDVLQPDGTVSGNDIALTESGSTGIYRGNFPAVSAGVYDLIFQQGGINEQAITVYWDGTNILNLGDVPTVAEITADIDANSTQLAAIVADTNELQTDDVPGLIAALNDLSAADVNAEVDTALADIHLDHLLAVDYDPANKPGTATALLNELIEDDGGVSRYTVNALENGPSGSGASAESIADAVWDEAIADHLAAGSTGEALDDASNAAGTTAADVWTYGTRTLTSTAVLEDELSGTTLTATRAVTLEQTFTGTIPSGWAQFVFTAKDNTDDADARSIVQIVETNPSAGSDGLQYIEGQAATAAGASLTVDQGAGTVVVTIHDDYTAQLLLRASGDGAEYDLKLIKDDSTSLIFAKGTFIVINTPTWAT